MKEFSFKTRQHNIDRMGAEIFDLVIVGGGIVGAGVARDAASRGLKVALVEKNDFAQGTSSRSSKMIHGGIRYLENLEFGLVFEALSERARLFEIAPHLVHPVRFILPLYKDSRVGMFKMGLGMWVYDALALFQSELHEHLNPTEAKDRLPFLRTEGLVGAYSYSDAYMDDDRLTIETLRSANDYGGVIANFVEARGSQIEDNHVVAIECFDNIKQKTFKIKGRHFVSCVGPWTDIFGKSLLPDYKPMLRPTKGIHITLAKDRIDLKEAVVMAAQKDGRIVFGVPRHDMIVIGTTDTDYKQSPDQVSSTKEDVTYLLSIINNYFPGAEITEDDIIGTYAGVRPLVDDGSTSAGKTSREHTIITDPRGITFVAGGKYTTYRLMSEQVVDRILRDFSIDDRVKFSNSKTDTPLNPNASPENLEKAKILATIWSQNSHLPEDKVTWLAARHGLEAESLILFGRDAKLSVWELEVHHAVTQTMCLNLTDFYTRRTSLFLGHQDHGLSHLDLLSYFMASELGWTDQEREMQKQSVIEHFQTELAWRKM